MLQLSLNSFVDILRKDDSDFEAAKSAALESDAKILDLQVTEFYRVTVESAFSGLSNLEFGTQSEIVDRLVDDETESLIILFDNSDQLILGKNIQFFVDLLELVSIIATAREKNFKKTKILFLV